MSEDKPTVAQQFNLGGIDFVSLIMSTRDMTIKTDTDLRAFKEQQAAAEARTFTMFNELKNDLNTIQMGVESKITSVESKIGDVSKALSKQTVIIVGILVFIAALSKTKLGEILPLFTG